MTLRVTLPGAIAGALATDRQLWLDFTALRDCRGRFAGSPARRPRLPR